ncbi:YqaJ viral recombinase family protein [Veronia pacifica]|uniref:YqaJ viral recombinase domain-containing protein n=1 Tax=Veronia pacifica TaxID=1080227 RepID=A0A1C3EL70_9GAMM|nr:YqaJ viral recombinase family protein [Veronia pacifica]ODA33981.1 hypothetical protein A8L45_08010 [Veronia pacifica]
MTACEQYPTKVDIHQNYVDALIEGTNYPNLSHEDNFHFQRRLGIGGSDVAAILGLSPYRTAYEVWEEKTGRRDPEDLSDNDRVHFGNELEDVVAKEYARRTGQKVQKRNYPFVNKTLPWLRANIDRHIVGADKGLECKTADKWAARDMWGTGNVYAKKNDEVVLVEADDEVPEHYMLQELHYMVVLDKRQWDLAVLIGGNDFRVYTMKWNQQLVDIVTQRLTAFWFEHVIADVAPEPQTLQDLESIYRQDNGNSIVATPDILDTFRHYMTLKEQIKALETEAYGPKVGGKFIGGLDMQIKAFMGEHAELLIDSEGKKLCSWKTQMTNRVDTAALKKADPELVTQFTRSTQNRVFRI